MVGEGVAPGLLDGQSFHAVAQAVDSVVERVEFFITHPLGRDDGSTVWNTISFAYVLRGNR